MTAPATEAPGGRRAARAFGLELDLSFEAPGLPQATGPPIGRPTTVDLVEPAEIDRDWPAGGVERVLEEHFERPEPDRTIDAHREAGYRLYARHFGLARIAPDGARILCSPPDVEPWSWQRFLVGRILPWAAVLRGLEVLHASAVTIDDRAIAFAGATGAGKTSLAIHLVARGASFLTDDVLALDQPAGELRAHPGASIASVRPAEWDALPPASWERLGTVLGHSGKTYLALPRPDGPAPLAAIYFLRGSEQPEVRPIPRPDPRLLLASTFVFGVQTPERLRNQLDVCAAIAATVPAYWLGVAPGHDSRRLAETVDEHARAVAPTA